MLLCGLTDKDLRRICVSQYEHPGSTIGYLPELCLGHVYIVLKPIGSARLRFDDGYIMSLCVLMYRRYFGVPDVITDMTRSLEMVET